MKKLDFIDLDRESLIVMPLLDGHAEPAAKLPKIFAVTILLKNTVVPIVQLSQTLSVSTTLAFRPGASGHRIDRPSRRR